MAKFYRGRVTAMLAAYAGVQRRICFFTEAQRRLHQETDPLLIQFCERIIFKNLVFIISIEELARIVPGEPIGHLRQIIGAKAEEVRDLCDFIRHRAGPRRFDHRPHFVFELCAGGADLCVRSLDYDLFDKCQLFGVCRQRNHDLRNDRPVRVHLLYIERRTDDCARCLLYTSKLLEKPELSQQLLTIDRHNFIADKFELKLGDVKVGFYVVLKAETEITAMERSLNKKLVEKGLFRCV